MKTNKQESLSNDFLSQKKSFHSFVTILIAIFVLGVFTGCSVSEDKIVGTWGQSFEENSLGWNQTVIVNFKSDHTGEMIVYSNQNYYGEKAAACTFDWSIDGYMVNLSGSYYDGSKQENFSTKFRYKDSKLVCEGILPAGIINLGQYHTTCVLSKQ